MWTASEPGVGAADFHAMETLDGDTVALTSSSSGKQAQRSIEGLTYQLCHPVEGLTYQLTYQLASAEVSFKVGGNV